MLNRGSRISAFTLVEVVVVMVILTIIVLAGVTIPFSSIKANKLIAAADKLAFDLRYAQQLAISKQVDCGVSFNPNANTYFVYANNTSNIVNSPYIATQLIVDYNSDRDFQGIDLAGTSFGNKVSFDFMGIPRDSSGNPLSAAGNISLQYGGHQKVVTIEANTGKIKVE